MARLFLSSTVANFDKWKQFYDGDEDRRKDAGLSSLGVYRKSGDENNILIVYEGDPNVMKNMLASKELGEKMKEAGVLAPPVIFTGEKF